MSQRETPWSRNRPKFLIVLSDFCTKFDVYNMDFQSFYLEIIRVWELFFGSVWKLLFLQTFMNTTKSHSSALWKLVSFNYWCMPHCKEVLYKKESQQRRFYWNRAHSYCWSASLKRFRKVHVHHAFFIYDDKMLLSLLNL